MGINDLMVEAPPKETNDATGGTTESGISSNIGLVFTGTPKAAGLDERVSVSVDLSMTGPATDAGVHGDRDHHRSGHRGPARARRQAERRAGRVQQPLPGPRLPFGVAPNREGARGSDVIIEGIAEGLTLRLDQFSPDMTSSLVAVLCVIVVALGVAALIGVLVIAARARAAQSRRVPVAGHR